MNLLSGIFIICALPSTARALQCFRCSDQTGTCSADRDTCSSAQNHTCKTTLTFSNASGSTITLFTKSCGICFGLTSFQSDIGTVTTESNCCSFDLCNNTHLPAELNTTLNGLECFGCKNTSFDTCVSSQSIVKCVGIQDHCLHDVSALFLSEQTAVNKGCASETLCRFPKSSAFGIQTTSDSNCCQGNLCNNATGLKCHSCVGVPGNCRTQTIHCTSSNCRTLNYKQVNGNSSSDLLVRGCGNCTGTLSFSSGEFSVHVADRCCQSNKCNNQSIAEEANTTLNGLECYGCSPISINTCEDPMERVKCVGEQKWCLHTLATSNSKQNVTIKGCASESICKNPDVVKPFGIVPKQDFYCCKESWCNRGSASNYSPAVHQSLSLLTLPLITLILCLF
ncbi:urokinase plasminogen activator surface receptor-like [Heptranchias perlo]|uniref:urokinase plasminogen activator surface receptor-like n=1 Tax=Heptranchias perlo TaxID=212740 RepID=UPI0035596F18